MSVRKPLVSVGMLVYNHEPYIATAIESILMQEVNFPYEIVIAEDCSTDNTRAVIERYQAMYPEIIKPIFQEKNLGMRLNSDSLRHNCIGKYRATLEGDDYWITTDKLQKQVDFLENNPDYIAIGADFACVDEAGLPCPFPWGNIIYTYCQDEEYTLDHMNQWLLPGHASTMLFHNVFATCSKEMLEKFENTMILGDRRTSLFLILQGRVRHEREVVTIRRVLQKSETSMTGVISTMNWHATSFKWLLEAERFAKEAFDVQLDLSKSKERRWLSAIKVFMMYPSKNNYRVMKEVYDNCGDKKKYRKIFTDRFSEKIGNEFRSYGLAVIPRSCVRALKFLRYVVKSRKFETNTKKRSILDAFSK